MYILQGHTPLFQRDCLDRDVKIPFTTWKVTVMRDMTRICELRPHNQVSVMKTHLHISLLEMEGSRDIDLFIL